MIWQNAVTALDDLHGGHFRSVHHLKPRAWDKPGLGWRDILENWIDGDASFPHVVSEAKIQVLTAPNGDRRICPVPADLDAWLSISSPFIRQGGGWIQPSLGAFTRSGNILTAETANVITQITHAGHYIKAGFALRNGWIPPLEDGTGAGPPPAAARHLVGAGTDHDLLAGRVLPGGNVRCRAVALPRHGCASNAPAAATYLR